MISGVFQSMDSFSFQRFLLFERKICCSQWQFIVFLFLFLFTARKKKYGTLNFQIKIGYIFIVLMLFAADGSFSYPTIYYCYFFVIELIYVDGEDF